MGCRAVVCYLSRCASRSCSFPFAATSEEGEKNGGKWRWILFKTVVFGQLRGVCFFSLNTRSWSKWFHASVKN